MLQFYRPVELFTVHITQMVFNVMIIKFTTSCHTSKKICSYFHVDYVTVKIIINQVPCELLYVDD